MQELLLGAKFNKAAERKEVSNVRHWQTLETKCSIKIKTLGVITEELKQSIVAIATKLRTY